ncbi:MAG: hypothetical protein KGD59_03680 [Candidatus Heimdallarchaeota archaeon]|nr:hypothetical protein [Candidatus Heimdallarchaeota archaeon]MBY8993625.1 hypothetical protein [Candidatus Heimdallarchaeota archaeon]
MFLLFSLTNSAVVSSITVGDSFEYRIIRSRITVTVGENSVETKKFAFGPNSYFEGTKISVLANFVGEGMNGEFTIKKDSRLFGYTADQFKMKIRQFLFLTTYFGYNLADNWAYESFDSGYYFFLYPYLIPTGTSWSFFASLDTYITTTLTPYAMPGYSLENNTNYVNNEEEVSFESWVGGEIDSSNGFIYGFTAGLSAKVSFGNQFQIAFDKTTGLCKGLRIRGWCEGTINGKSIEISLDYQYETKNYNLPSLSLGSYNNYFSKLPYLYFLIPSILLPSAIVILLVRKKRTINT